MGDGPAWTPQDRERLQVEMFDRAFALPARDRMHRRNAARQLVGLPPLEVEETPIARIRRRNAALRRAGERPTDPRDNSHDTAL